MRQIFARIRIALVMSMLMILASGTAAYAHAALLATDPADNAVVAIAPESIDLSFNEPVNPLAITLIDLNGARTDLLDATVGGQTVVVKLPDQLPQGTHVLSWRVVSTDGHPIGGSMVFSIGTVTGAAPELATTDGAVDAMLWATKTILFVSLFAGIGAGVFATFAPLPQSCRQAGMIMAIIGVVAALSSLGLQGLDALGLSLSPALDGMAWRAGLSTSYGATALIALLAFVVAAAAIIIRAGRLSTGLAWMSLIAGALSLGLSGHASAASPQWLTRPAVFLHIAGLIFWIGALLPLWIVMRDRSSASHLALARFSRFIPLAVAPIIVSGITLAAIQMGPWGSQWLAPYGIILVIKLALLAILFGVALWNRHWLTEPALAGDSTARHRLRHSIRFEIALVLIILGLVAGWRFTPPPRTLAQVPAEAAPIMIHLVADRTMAMVTVSPGRPGLVDLDLWLTDTEGAPIAPDAVSVMLAEPLLGIEPLKAAASKVDESNWHVERLAIPIPGNWIVEIDIRLSRFQLVKLKGEIKIP